MKTKNSIKGNTQTFVETYQEHFSGHVRFTVQQKGKLESDHDYMATVHIPHGNGHTYTGKGRSKREARKNAAKSALKFQKRWLPE